MCKGDDAKDCCIEYGCNRCKYSTLSADELQNHYRTHRDRYKCYYCSRSFPSTTNLNGHINKHHLNVEPYVCVCGYRKSHMFSVQRHMRACPVYLQCMKGQGGNEQSKYKQE